MASLDYIHVTYAEPHAQRARQMLAAHPELRELSGPQPASALWIVALLSLAGTMFCALVTLVAKPAVAEAGRAE